MTIPRILFPDESARTEYSSCLFDEVQVTPDCTGYVDQSGYQMDYGYPNAQGEINFGPYKVQRFAANVREREADVEHQFGVRGVALSRADVPVREAIVEDRHPASGHRLHRFIERSASDP